MNNGKNKLILFLSDYKDRNKGDVKKYKKFNNGIVEKIVEGEQTPDAPSRYFFECLKEKNQSIDEILCITSKKSNEKAYECYKKVVEDFYKNENKIPKIVKIAYDYDFENNKHIEENEIHKNLCRDISKEVYPNDTVYIDYTSGMRDISLLIILIIKYLEYKGAVFGGMIYSYNDFSDSENCKIIDIKSIYELFELFKGVNEFTSFGKSKTLSNYYQALKEIEGDDYKPITNLISTMDEFSDMMNLCILDDIDELIKKLNKNIIEVKNIKESNKSDELIIYMFLNLIDEIEKKFYLDEENSDITYLKLIKWCLDNELIQQALTLYVEKMPKEYFDLNFFDYVKMDDSFNEEYDKIFYTDIFDLSRYLTEIIDEASGQIINIAYIKEIIKINKEDIINGSDYIKKYNGYTKKILVEIKNILKNLYRINTYRVCKRKPIVELCNNIPRKVEKFVNYLDQQNKLIDYIIKNVVASNQNGSSNSSSDRDRVYDRKLNTILEIKKINKKPKWCNIEMQDLTKIMQDYLLCKIFRNQINHAKGSNLSTDIKEFFEKNGYRLDIKVNNIKEMMRIAVKNIEDISANL